MPIPVEDYAYDGEGNWVASHLSAVYASNDHNQLLEDDSHTYAYDAKGNRVTRTAKAGGAVESYTYDSQNRLVGYAGASTASYAYDALDRRIAKTVDGAVEAFVYDPWSASSTTANDAVLDFTGGTLTRRWLHGPQTDEPLAYELYTSTTTPGTGTARDLHADRLGNILRVVDPATGTVAVGYDYDSFGNRTQTGTLEQRYGFTGREHDAESGLIYFRARHYDPSSGIFLQHDPIGFAGGDLNLYAYVENDPLNLTDPSGLATQAVQLRFVAGVSWAAAGIQVLAKRCLAMPNCRSASLDKLRNGIDDILEGLGITAPQGSTATGALQDPGLGGIFEGILGLVDSIVRNMREITKAAANEGTGGDGGGSTGPEGGDEGPGDQTRPDPYFDPEGAEHILDGHKFGAGAGKTEFPESWSEDDIMHAVEEIARNGNEVPFGANEPGATMYEGIVNEVDIEVVVGADGRISTGYATGGPGVVLMP